VDVQYGGPWIIVDNGYFNWSTTISPLKTTADLKEIRWSYWLESMRKDVECTFGIMKGRWHILKTGIRCHGVAVADDIWRTCCALHNMLLEVDGLNVERSGDASLHEEEGRFFALQHLHGAQFDRRYDSSSMGPGDDVEASIGAGGEVNTDQNKTLYDENLIEVRKVKNLSMGYFHEKLIAHFDILFQQFAIAWPCRNDKK
jgi:hypothetical protein